MDASTEFLHYHQYYGHISPKCIQAMAKHGILPRCLANCPVPNCQACFYSKATKKPETKRGRHITQLFNWESASQST